MSVCLCVGTDRESICTSVWTVLCDVDVCVCGRGTETDRTERGCVCHKCVFVWCPGYLWYPSGERVLRVVYNPVLYGTRVLPERERASLGEGRVSDVKRSRCDSREISPFFLAVSWKSTEPRYLEQDRTAESEPGEVSRKAK